MNKYILALSILLISSTAFADSKWTAFDSGATSFTIDDVDDTAYLTGSVDIAAIDSSDIPARTCVKGDGFIGVTATDSISWNIIYSGNYNVSVEDPWVIILKPEGVTVRSVDGIETVACSKVLQGFSEEQRKTLGDWIDGTANNPMTRW